jgi:hypothetical protein
MLRAVVAVGWLQVVGPTTFNQPTAKSAHNIHQKLPVYWRSIHKKSIQPLIIYSKIALVTKYLLIETL